jgi:hypothetical protein
MIKEIDLNHGANYNSEEAFKKVKQIIQEEDPLRKHAKDCILNLYPDCQSEKMSRNDPRLNQLEWHSIGQLPQYAFPIGYQPKFQPDRPHHEVLPMVFNATKIYMQFLIFYENLETQHKTAMNLYDKVQEEIDAQNFDEMKEDDP